MSWFKDHLDRYNGAEDAPLDLEVGADNPYENPYDANNPYIGLVGDQTVEVELDLKKLLEEDPTDGFSDLVTNVSKR